MRAAALAIVLVLSAAPPVMADGLGITLPRRSRQIAPNHHVSSKSFRKTVVFFRKQLSRRGYAHKEIPVYRYRGVLVARFVAEGKTTKRWNAIHVFRLKGRTYIYVVEREPDKGVDPPQSSK